MRDTVFTVALVHVPAPTTEGVVYRRLFSKPPLGSHRCSQSGSTQHEPAMITRTTTMNTRKQMALRASQLEGISQNARRVAMASRSPRIDPATPTPSYSLAGSYPSFAAVSDRGAASLRG